MPEHAESKDLINDRDRDSNAKSTQRTRLLTTVKEFPKGTERVNVVDTNDLPSTRTVDNSADRLQAGTVTL